MGSWAELCCRRQAQLQKLHGFLRAFKCKVRYVSNSIYSSEDCLAKAVSMSEPYWLS